MGVKEKPLFVPELIREQVEVLGGKVAQDEVMQEVDDKTQSDLEQLMAFRSSVNDATGVIPANLVVERMTRIPGKDVYKRQQYNSY